MLVEGNINLEKKIVECALSAVSRSFTKWYCIASSQELPVEFTICSVESSPHVRNVSSAVQQKLTQILKYLFVPLQWSLAAMLYRLLGPKVDSIILL